MIVLNEKDQDSLLDMKELISEVEIAFENYSKNQTVT
ncbi:ornithine cyclodeaminase family protein, partial [Staphylococcus gallinarum]